MLNFKHSDLLKKFEQPIRVLKIECSEKLCWKIIYRIGPRPKVRFIFTLPEKSEVDVGAIRFQLILVSHFTCTPSSYYHLQSLQITLSVTTEYILLSGHRSISIYRLKPVLSDPLRYVHNKEPHNSQLDWVNIPFLCRHLVTPIYLVRTYNASLS